MFEFFFSRTKLIFINLCFFLKRSKLEALVQMGYNRQEIEESLASSRYDDVFATYLLLGRKNTDVSLGFFFLFIFFDFITQRSRVLVGTLFFLHKTEEPKIISSKIRFLTEFLSIKFLTNQIFFVYK